MPAAAKRWMPWPYWPGRQKRLEWRVWLKRRLHRCASLLLVLLAMAASPVPAADIEREKLAAVYIYRLMENILWPEQAQIDQYRVHLIDHDDRVYEYLSDISRLKSLHGRPFIVTRSRSALVPDDAHVVFLARGQEDHHSFVLGQVEGKSVLLISDGLDDKRRLMVNLLDGKDKRLVFELNRANLLNQHLEIEPDIVLLGGTEIDVARLYKESRALLEAKEQALLELEAERLALEETLASTRQESQQLEGKIQRQQAQYAAQKSALADKAEVLNLLQTQLDEAKGNMDHLQTVIDVQHAAINEQEQQFLRLADKLQQQASALAEQKREIDLRQRTLVEQDVKILDQNEMLDQQYRVISTQKDFLYLMAAVVVLLVALSISIYRGYRHKKIANAMLAQTAAELAKTKKIAESASEAKSTFLASMSHELRTPLNSILGFSELMADDPTMPASHLESIETINSSGRHLLSMINDVLDFSKIEAGMVELQPEQALLRELIHDVEVMMRGRAEKKGLQLLIDVAPSVPASVCIDGAKFRQILINLLGNAIKFSDSGTVSLMVEADVHDSTARLRFVVNDQGPGIAKGVQDKIFDPFVQGGDSARRHKGTGLGLAICKQFVQLMGGTISIDSAPGAGASFNFDILLQLPQRSGSEESIDAERRVLGLQEGELARRVMIVEDMKNNRVILRRLLEKVGYRVVEAADGKQAVETFSELEPDFIWMDMHMPVMSGYEATRAIRALPGGEKVVIYALTANAVLDQKDDIVACGCDGVVYKPYRQDELLDIMSETLGVEYQYADAPATLKPELLTVEDLSVLPLSMLQDIRDAAQALNQEALADLLLSLGSEHGRIRDGLSALDREFKFEDIINLCEAAIKNHDQA